MELGSRASITQERMQNMVMCANMRASAESECDDKYNNKHIVVDSIAPSIQKPYEEVNRNDKQIDDTIRKFNKFNEQNDSNYTDNVVMQIGCRHPVEISAVTSLYANHKSGFNTDHDGQISAEQTMYDIRKHQSANIATDNVSKVASFNISHNDNARKETSVSCVEREVKGSTDDVTKTNMDAGRKPAKRKRSIKKPNRYIHDTGNPVTQPPKRRLLEKTYNKRKKPDNTINAKEDGDLWISNLNSTVKADIQQNSITLNLKRGKPRKDAIRASDIIPVNSQNHNREQAVFKDSKAHFRSHQENKKVTLHKDRRTRKILENLLGKRQLVINIQRLSEQTLKKWSKSFIKPIPKLVQTHQMGRCYQEQSRKSYYDIINDNNFAEFGQVTHISKPTCFRLYTEKVQVQDTLNLRSTKLECSDKENQYTHKKHANTVKEVRDFFNIDNIEVKTSDGLHKPTCNDQPIVNPNSQNNVQGVKGNKNLRLYLKDEEMSKETISSTENSVLSIDESLSKCEHKANGMICETTDMKTELNMPDYEPDSDHDALRTSFNKNSGCLQVETNGKIQQRNEISPSDDTGDSCKLADGNQKDNSIDKGKDDDESTDGYESADSDSEWCVTVDPQNMGKPSSGSKSDKNKITHFETNSKTVEHYTQLTENSSQLNQLAVCLERTNILVAAPNVTNEETGCQDIIHESVSVDMMGCDPRKANDKQVSIKDELYSVLESTKDSNNQSCETPEVSMKEKTGGQLENFSDNSAMPNGERNIDQLDKDISLVCMNIVIELVDAVVAKSITDTIESIKEITTVVKVSESYNVEVIQGEIKPSGEIAKSVDLEMREDQVESCSDKMEETEESPNITNESIHEDVQLTQQEIEADDSSCEGTENFNINLVENSDTDEEMDFNLKSTIEDDLNSKTTENDCNSGGQKKEMNDDETSENVNNFTAMDISKDVDLETSNETLDDDATIDTSNNPDSNEEDQSSNLCKNKTTEDQIYDTSELVNNDRLNSHKASETSYNSCPIESNQREHTLTASMVQNDTAERDNSTIFELNEANIGVNNGETVESRNITEDVSNTEDNNEIDVNIAQNNKFDGTESINKNIVCSEENTKDPTIHEGSISPEVMDDKNDKPENIKDVNVVVYKPETVELDANTSEKCYDNQHQDEEPLEVRDENNESETTDVPDNCVFNDPSAISDDVKERNDNDTEIDGRTNEDINNVNHFVKQPTGMEDDVSPTNNSEKGETMNEENQRTDDENEKNTEMKHSVMDINEVKPDSYLKDQDMDSSKEITNIETSSYDIAEEKTSMKDDTLEGSEACEQNEQKVVESETISGSLPLENEAEMESNNNVAEVVDKQENDNMFDSLTNNENKTTDGSYILADVTNVSMEEIISPTSDEDANANLKDDNLTSEETPLEYESGGDVSGDVNDQSAELFLADDETLVCEVTVGESVTTEDVILDNITLEGVTEEKLDDNKENETLAEDGQCSHSYLGVGGETEISSSEECVEEQLDKIEETKQPDTPEVAVDMTEVASTVELETITEVVPEHMDLDDNRSTESNEDECKTSESMKESQNEPYMEEEREEVTNRMAEDDAKDENLETEVDECAVAAANIPEMDNETVETVESDDTTMKDTFDVSNVELNSGDAHDEASMAVYYLQQVGLDDETKQADASSNSDSCHETEEYCESEMEPENLQCQGLGGINLKIRDNCSPLNVFSNATEIVKTSTNGPVKEDKVSMSDRRWPHNSQTITDTMELVSRQSDCKFKKQDGSSSTLSPPNQPNLPHNPWLMPIPTSISQEVCNRERRISTCDGLEGHVIHIPEDSGSKEHLRTTSESKNRNEICYGRNDRRRFSESQVDKRKYQFDSSHTGIQDMSLCRPPGQHEASNMPGKNFPYSNSVFQSPNGAEVNKGDRFATQTLSSITSNQDIRYRGPIYPGQSYMPGFQNQHSSDYARGKGPQADFMKHPHQFRSTSNIPAVDGQTHTTNLELNRLREPIIKANENSDPTATRRTQPMRKSETISANGKFDNTNVAMVNPMINPTPRMSELYEPISPTDQETKQRMKIAKQNPKEQAHERTTMQEENREAVATKIRKVYSKYKNSKYEDGEKDDKQERNVDTSVILSEYHSQDPSNPPLNVDDIQHIVDSLDAEIKKKEAELKTLYWRKSAMLYISQQLKEKQHMSSSNNHSDRLQEAHTARGNSQSNPVSYHGSLVASQASSNETRATNLVTTTTSALSSGQNGLMSPNGDNNALLNTKSDNPFGQYSHHYSSVPYLGNISSHGSSKNGPASQEYPVNFSTKHAQRGPPAMPTRTPTNHQSTSLNESRLPSQHVVGPPQLFSQVSNSSMSEPPRSHQVPPSHRAGATKQPTNMNKSGDISDSGTILARYERYHKSHNSQVVLDDCYICRTRLQKEQVSTSHRAKTDSKISSLTSPIASQKSPDQIIAAMPLPANSDKTPTSRGFFSNPSVTHWNAQSPQIYGSPFWPYNHHQMDGMRPPVWHSPMGLYQRQAGYTDSMFQKNMPWQQYPR